MVENIKKHQGWVLPLIFNIIVGAAIYMHSLSVRAAIVDELKSYVTKEDLSSREQSHEKWAAEALKRLEGKIDDLVKRLESRRFERSN